MNLDLSFANAALVLPREFQTLKIYIIGAGGTGSFAAMAIARLCFEIERTGKKVELTIIDPDRVEAGNIPRSNFCAAEIGRFKAQTLATRITMAWGLEIGYINEALNYEKHIEPDRNSYKELTVLVGCVDNHAARTEIYRALKESNRNRFREVPKTWWIDGGNGKSSWSGSARFGVKKRVEEKSFYLQNNLPKTACSVGYSPGIARKSGNGYKSSGNATESIVSRTCQTSGAKPPYQPACSSRNCGNDDGISVDQ